MSGDCEIPVPTPAELVLVQTSAVDPERIAIRLEMIAEIREAMWRIPERHVYVLRRWYEDGWTFQEIGDRLYLTKARAAQIRRDAENMLCERLGLPPVYAPQLAGESPEAREKRRAYQRAYQPLYRARKKAEREARRRHWL